MSNKFKKEQMSRGEETIEFSCGCKDKGEKEDGRFVGKIEMTWCDGSTYNGAYNGHDRKTLHYQQTNEHTESGCNGYGKYTFPNGDWHEGYYQDNFANGSGIFYYSKNKLKWKGSWINNRSDGEGVFIKENGETYIGDWIQRALFEESNAPDSCVRNELEDYLWDYYDNYDLPDDD